MMQTLGEFLSPQAGQERRKWLDETLGQFIPPELRGWVGAGAELNPVTNMERAGAAAQRMTAPGQSGWDRMAAAGDMATNMGAVLAPVAAAKMAGPAGADAANAIVEALTAASPMRGAMQDFAADEFGGVGFGDDVASRGAQIMDMLRSGRGADVTDEMLDMGDATANARLNEWLFNNYDLPMDAASRAARAKDAGFRGPTFHATSADIAAIDPARMDTGMSYGTGEGAFWTTTQPKTADTYLPGAYVKEGSGGAAMGDGVERYYTEGANVIPTMNRLRNADVWDMGGGGYPTGGVGKYITDARRSGSDVVLFQRMKDQGIMGLGSGSADNTSIAAVNPTTVRSRFARFDPRLAHLRNLSAGLGIPLAAYLGQDPETLGSYLEAQ